MQKIQSRILIKSMEKNRFEKDTLNHFVEDDYSRTEYKRVCEWFAEEENPDLKYSLSQHWKQLPPDQKLNPRLISLLEVLKTQISFTRSKRCPFFNIYQKIAAVLFIPLLIGVSLLCIFPLQKEDVMATVTIHSSEGARTEFVLPDGSHGWLNSGSELTYPVLFCKKREVRLEGEAFFDVVHRSGAKFYVKTSELSVQVLGTSFDVSAYHNDSEVSIILKKGIVQVLNADDIPIYIMKPDERLDYSLSNKSAKISNVDAEVQTLWTQGILQFRGESLFEVMKKLGRWYNVDFEIKDQQLQKYSFKATFKDEQLEEILKMIAITTPMKYKIEERVTDKDGVYKRKKVIIEKK